MTFFYRRAHSAKAVDARASSHTLENLIDRCGRRMCGLTTKHANIKHLECVTSSLKHTTACPGFEEMGRLLDKYRDIIGKNTRNLSCLKDVCFIKHKSGQRQSLQNSLGVWPGVTSVPPGPKGSSRGVSCGSSGGKSRMGASSGECGMGSTCTQKTAQRVSGGRRGESEGYFCTSVCNVAVMPPSCPCI